MPSLSERRDQAREGVPAWVTAVLHLEKSCALLSSQKDGGWHH